MHYMAIVGGMAAINPYIQAGFNSFYVYLQGMYTAELKEANVRKEWILTSTIFSMY